MKPIGRDALVFMINAANPVKSLTEEQIQSIYTGETTNWKELGGNDEEIVAFQRKQNSGSQTLMEKLVMKGISMAEAPSYHYINSMGELLDQVSSYNNQGNAIGYSVYFYARNMYSVPGLEFLSVDGVTPSNDTIRNGSYPYVNEFYAVIRDDEPEDSPARLLFDWLTSEGGQELISDTGYVPSPGDLFLTANSAYPTYGARNHIGFVEWVERDSRGNVIRIHTIEGNYGWETHSPSVTRVTRSELYPDKKDSYGMFISEYINIEYLFPNT